MDGAIRAAGLPMELTLSGPTAERLQRAATDGTREAGPTTLRQAGQEFEAYFFSYLMKVMRETVPKGPFHSQGGELFLSLYDQEIGRLAAEAGGLGVAAMIEGHYREK